MAKKFLTGAEIATVLNETGILPLPPRQKTKNATPLIQILCGLDGLENAEVEEVRIERYSTLNRYPAICSPSVIFKSRCS